MRPPLSSEQKRTRRKHVLFSAAEWATVVEHARGCGVTPNSYIRSRALGQLPRVRQNGLTRELVVAVNRIGTNINQLARAANETGALPREAVFEAAVGELVTLLRGIVAAQANARADTRSDRLGEDAT